MNMKLKELLTVSLSESLEKWWDNGKVVANEGFTETPSVGENSFYLMAQNAINVIMANIDIEDYFEEEGRLKFL
jgi:hypothetical protein